MEPPVWCQASLPPSRDRGDGSGQDKNLSRRMKEAVCQRVDFQPGNGVHRVAAYVADHVVPLKDLVEHNAVNEAPKTQAVQQPGHLRRRLTNHPRRNRTAMGTAAPYPAMHWLRPDRDARIQTVRRSPITTARPRFMAPLSAPSLELPPSNSVELSPPLAGPWFRSAQLPLWLLTANRLGHRNSASHGSLRPESECYIGAQQTTRPELRLPPLPRDPSYGGSAAGYNAPVRRVAQ